MVKFLIHRPIAVIMTFIAILLLGGVAAGLLPVSLMPDIDIPEITVQVSRPGISVREMENSIVRRLRQNLMQVPRLDDISSEAGEGTATIRMRFNFGADINYAFIDVNEQVDAAMRNLPNDMERPAIIKASATDLPVFYINMWLKDSTAGDSRFMEMCELNQAVMVKRMEQLGEVAMVDVTGQLEPELYILPLSEKMKPLSLTYDNISSALEQNNVTLGSLEVEDGQYRFNIRFSNAVRTVEDVKNIWLKAEGRLLQLKDIADIGIRAISREGAFVADGRNALSLAVIKQSDARMEDLKKGINDLIWVFGRDYPDIEFELVRDQTSLLQYAISNLLQSLVVGALLAFLIMFFFLKDARSPWLIGLSIPVSLVISILFFYMVGLSVNIISLSGLILGVGMMIDNSIIVIDNITQYIQRGESLANSCIKGTTEVIRPLISSVLTTCAVFLPLIFLSGISGALFYDQAVAVTVGLLVSLVVSVTLLPTLYRLFWLNREKRNDIRGGRFSAWLEKINLFKVEEIYERGYRWVFKRRKSVFLSFCILLFVAGFLFVHMPKERFPKFKQTELMVRLDWNEKVNVSENLNRTQELLDYLQNDVLKSNSFVGSQNYVMHKDMDLSLSEALLYLVFRDEDEANLIEVKIKGWFTEKYPAASCTLSAPETIFEKLFAGDDTPVVARISNGSKKGVPELDLTQEIVHEINHQIPYTAINPIQSEEFWEVRVKPELLALYEVDQNKLYSRLKSAINSFSIGILKTGAQYVPIVVSDEKKRIDRVINELKITNNLGDEIPVHSLIDLIPTHDYKLMYGGKEGAFIQFAFAQIAGSPEELMQSVRNILRAKGNINVSFTGSWFVTQVLVKELMIVLLISLALLYFILAAQFESFSQPIIVMLEVPIDIAGALGLLWLFGGTINIMAMIGIVVMSGIIINDSILKIDTINQLRKEGMRLVEAIETAGHRRIKPIIMTSLTTILALVPFLWGTDMGSELQRPLALTVIGGMIIGTLVSLYFVPLCYYYLNRNSEQ